MQKFTGTQYLQIDIASNFGLDKSSWDDRLDWFKDNEHRLDEIIHEAAEPALFYAGVQAWRACQAGQPSGYPISLDATSSGLQLLACLTGDRMAAQLCNVINKFDPSTEEPRRMDAYSAVYAAMLEAIGETGKITRKMAKDAVMTALYGSKAVPKKVFGEGALLSTFFETMIELAPAAWELNETMPMFWQQTACHSWIMPDNFHVHVKVMDTVEDTVHFLNEPFTVYSQVNRPTEEGRSLGANTIHSLDGMVVREMTRRCNYDAKHVAHLKDICHDIVYSDFTVVGEVPENEDAKMVRTLWDHYEQTGYLSARILDHLWMHNISLVDARVVLELLGSLPEKPFQLMTIHDCFRCLPNYGNDLRQQYNLQLKLIAKSSILESMLSQITGRHIPVTKLDANMWKDIESTEYALS